MESTRLPQVSLTQLLKDPALMASLNATDLSTLESMLPSGANWKSDANKIDGRSYLSTISTNFKLEPISGAAGTLN